MRLRRYRRRSYRSRKSWSRRLARWFFIPLATAIAAVITAEALDFVMLNVLSRDVSQECAVTGVVDGDTVRVSCNTLPVSRGRIRGMDAPELYSPSCVSEVLAAQQAKLALQRLLWSADKVQMVFHGEDKYQRELISLTVDGMDVSRQMIANGYARPYSGGERESWC